MDTIDTAQDLFYRLSLAIGVPYGRFDPSSLPIAERFQTPEITLWEIKQRAYYYGQQIIADRIHTRDALLSYHEITHRDKNYSGPKDPYEDHMFSIAYIPDTPYDNYARERRKVAGSGRGKKIIIKRR